MHQRTEQEIMQNWKGDHDAPVVSVCCITYNHEPYIAEAIDGFLIQQTDFPFEIIVRDDCSTDNTASIIREYVEEYPDIIKPIFESENQYSKGVRPMPVVFKQAVGEYFALCEGDDYWVDSLKLQRQVDGLKHNDQCSFAGHDVNIVESDKAFIGKHSKGRINDKWNTGVVNSRIALSAVWSVPHTSAMLFRRKDLDMEIITLDNFLGGDYILFVSLCAKGDLYYINKIMSEYRKHKTSVSAAWVYAYNDKFMDEVVRVHTALDNYFNSEFEAEIYIHLNGQYMTKYTQQLVVSIENLQVVETINNLGKMFKCRKNSQYTFRDILWIFRKEVARKMTKMRALKENEV